MKNVLLATDGGGDARRAAKTAIEMAEETGATLHVICVVDERRFHHPALSSAELVTIYAEDHAAEYVKEVKEMAEKKDIRVEEDTRYGIPHEVIIECADEIDADVIVIGEQGNHDEHFSGVRRKILDESDREVRVVGAEGRRSER